MVIKLKAIIDREEMPSNTELYNTIEHDWMFETAWFWRSRYSLKIEKAEPIPPEPGKINDVPEELIRKIVGYLDIHSARMFACTSHKMFRYTQRALGDKLCGVKKQ